VRSQKDKEKDNKTLKKLELQLKACQDSYMNIQLQYEKILNQVERKIELLKTLIFDN
jgi:predicted  nucleic acid-binding Zn-ribbon protein